MTTRRRFLSAVGTAAAGALGLAWGRGDGRAFPPGQAKKTPTATATATRTPSPEPTATAVPTDAPTAVPSATATDEPTATAEAAPTATPTETPTMVERTNWARNPSMEVEPWFNYLETETVTRDGADAAPGAGTSCLHAVVPGDDASEGIAQGLWATTPMLPGETWTLSWYARGTVSLKAGVLYKVGASTFSSQQGLLTRVLTGAWVRHHDTFVVPTVGSGVDQIGRLEFFCPAATAGEFRLDGILLEQSSSLESYFDGDTPGCSWEGTPHASRSIYGDPPAASAASSSALAVSLGVGLGD